MIRLVFAWLATTPAWTWLQGKKTYLVSLIAILTGVLTILNGDDVMQAWQQILEGFMVIFLRSGISVAQKPEPPRLS
jgi:hypothetical protein